MIFKNRALRRLIILILTIVVVVIVFELSRHFYLMTWAKIGIPIENQFTNSTQSLSFSSTIMKLKSNYRYEFSTGSCLLSFVDEGYYQLRKETLRCRSLNLINYSKQKRGHNQDYPLNDILFLIHRDTLLCLGKNKKNIDYKLISKNYLKD